MSERPRGVDGPDAKARRMVEAPDGTRGRLEYVEQLTGRATVLVGRRHVRKWFASELTALPIDRAAVLETLRWIAIEPRSVPEHLLVVTATEAADLIRGNNPNQEAT